MNYIEKDGGILLTGQTSFSLQDTLDCGQCFRAYEISDNKYYVIAHDKILTVTKVADMSFYFYPTNINDFEKIWVNYFDLDRDYDAIKEALAANDFVMRDATEYASGIRLLKQDFFECLISYIISQNNRIPMIKKVIKNISVAFGEQIGEIEGENCYSFPKLDVLITATEAELRALKTGFRDKYIVDACRKLADSVVDPDRFKHLSTAEIRKELMKINGVGVKVSDCVILFSIGRYNSFPTDVWIKRVMQHFYCNGQETKIEEIHALAEKKYGQYAGFAQEYLFYYARQFKIGK